MSGAKTGSCLCGDVVYRYFGSSKVFQYCHCSRCRKVTGSAHASNIIVDPEQFEWLAGEQLVGRYEVPEAKHFATSFCRQCGSSLPWLTKSKKAVIVPAGSLDSDPLETPIHHIYYKDKAPWYEEGSKLKKHAALPIRPKSK